MRLIVVLVLLLATGCSSIRNKAGDAARDFAIEQVTRIVDQQLERRDLSIAEITSVLDVDRDGHVQKAEAWEQIRLAAFDLVVEMSEQKRQEAVLELEGKFNELASAKDVGELKAKAEEIDLFSWGTLGALGLVAVGTAVANKKSTGKTNARLVILEKALNKDLDGDGVIGTPPQPKPEG